MHVFVELPSKQFIIIVKIRILVTHFSQCSVCIPPENMRWSRCLQGVQMEHWLEMNKENYKIYLLKITKSQYYHVYVK